MSTEIRIAGGFELLISLSDECPPDVITRASEPGFPYWQHNGEPLTFEQTIEHLAHNALSNGVTDLSDLDGWADLDRGVATMRVTDVEPD